MKIEVEVHEIPKDKDGFWDDKDNEMLFSLPILVFCEDRLEPCIVDPINFSDWVSDFNKERYKYYIKLSEIRL